MSEESAWYEASCNTLNLLSYGILSLNGLRKQIEEKQKANPFALSVSVPLKPINGGFRFRIRKLTLTDSSNERSYRDKSKNKFCVMQTCELSISRSMMFYF
jgi:hypothetical protein